MKVPGIELSNGHILQYVIASGGLAYDGKGWPWDYPLRWCKLLDERLFTTTMKTVTLSPRKGNFRWWNPMGCIRFLPDGTVNSFGLTNPGINWWCREIGPTLNSSKRPLIGSILGEADDHITMADKLNRFDLVGLEINASCPNTEEDVLTNTSRVIRSCEIARTCSRFPIILKLSVVHDIEAIVPEVEKYVQAFAINSVPWAIAYPDRESPLVHLGGGGVSGKAVQPHTWKFIEKLVGMTNIPVIGPSIWDYEDIDRVIELGAKAVSFGAVLMRYPLRPTKFVRRHIVENQ